MDCRRGLVSDMIDHVVQDINKTSTEINKRQVLISTSSKTIEKLRKSIEDSIKDKEKFIQDKEAIQGEFKNVEAKAFVIQEKFTQLQEVCVGFRAVLFVLSATSLCAGASLPLANSLHRKSSQLACESGKEYESIVFLEDISHGSFPA